MSVAHEYYRLEGTQPVPVGGSAAEVAAWERWFAAADRGVATTQIRAGDVTLTVDTFFIGWVEDEGDGPMLFATTIETPHAEDERLAVTDEMTRRIDVVADLVGRSREGGGEGWFSLDAIRKDSASWEAAEQDHQRVVDVALAVLTHHGAASIDGVQTTWTRKDRR
jgi:hypothetical protein